MVMASRTTKVDGDSQVPTSTTDVGSAGGRGPSQGEDDYIASWTRYYKRLDEWRTRQQQKCRKELYNPDACEHATMAVVYRAPSKGTLKCNRCGKRRVGWIYRCTVDRGDRDDDDVDEHVKDGLVSWTYYRELHKIPS